MEQNKETFEYTYSAQRQEEIERIRRKYMPKEEDKLELLRKLDRDVTKPGTIWSLVLGVLGTLLFGVGMCCFLVWGEAYFVLGIAVGVIGLAVLGSAYPVYVTITEKQKEKLAPQILALTEELGE